MIKLFLLPEYHNPDNAHGGIRRIVEAQHRYLPDLGIEFVKSIGNADIVATHATEYADVPVDIPWVVHCHGLMWSDYNWPGWAGRVNEEVIQAMKMADHVTAPSEWVAYAIKRGIWINPTVLTHGIDADEWEPAENYGYVLWNKARMDAISNPEPMNKLADMAPDIHFISTYGRPGRNVNITGKKPFEMMKLDIQNANIYLATTRETFGIGTLEAMACGVPILGWDFGGQAEFIKHKETGWLAPVGDYYSLLEGLRYLIKNRDRIGQAAREDVLNRFTWDKVMPRYAELYHNLVERAQVNKTIPKVSVIVPLYNLGHLLPDMVKSVTSQTLKDWEMVIVDDASTDNSLEIANKIAKDDPRIMVIHSDRNLKLPGALNVGFKCSKGKYTINLDPDNMITPNTLKVLSDALDNDRSIHITYGRIQFVLEDGVTPDPVTGTQDGVSHWPPEFSCVDQFRHRNQIPSSSMCRRIVHERTGGYRDRAKVAEDAEFWTRAVSYGFHPKKVTNAVTLIYRYRPDSKSRDETEPDWTAWMPWTKDFKLTPWGAAVRPMKEVGRSWPVPSYSPALVTVIIPVGPGHEGLVIDALDSVEAQIFRNWDCIVINDTGKELKIPHPWARILDTKGKQGPSVARNLGIKEANTDAIVCLDADDIMQPDCLDVMYQVWVQNKEDIVYSDWWDDKGDNIEIWQPPDWEPERLITEGCIFATCAMYPRSLWEKVGGYDENIDIWEDWDFQIACALKGACAIKIEKPLFTYRKTTGMRRDNFAGKGSELYELGKSMFFEKYPGMWNGHGKEKLKMACGGCGNRRRAAPMPPTVKKVLPEGATLLEYIGTASKSTFVGKETRTKYRFGNTGEHKRKFVYNQDVDAFLKMSNQFKEVRLSPTTPSDRPVLSGVMEG